MPDIRKHRGAHPEDRKLFAAEQLPVLRTAVSELSSVHGSYRSVNETETAIALIGESLAMLQPKSVAWLLDRPISNSGRLAKRIRDVALEKRWKWSVEVVFNPDREIVSSDRIVVSSDGPLLDRVNSWVDLNRQVIDARLADLWL